MTATMSFIVIDENYPEYRLWFRPLGLVWISALGFQMVNNSVHWASDYPLGIAMGYVFGKAASQYGKKSTSIAQTSNLNFYPLYFGNNEDRNYGIMGIYDF